MSFYMGGQRFKSRPPPSAQPLKVQPPATDLDLDIHPLRSNSVSQESSPSASARQPTTANPTSYAARAQNKLPLSVDTSPPQLPQSSFVSPDATGGFYSTSDGLTPTGEAPHTSRKGSVPDRSPLQKLEKIETVGDLTKEQKRARIEEAERNLRQGKQNAMSSSKSIPRKPVGSSNGDVRRSKTQASSQTNSGYSSADDVFVASSGRKYRKTSLGLEPFPSRDRALGYDSLRGTGAAAAALGAYQAGRGTSQDTPASVEHSRASQRQFVADNARATSSANEALNGSARSNDNRNRKAITQAQNGLQTEGISIKSGMATTQEAQEDDDAVPRHQARDTGSNNATYVFPPQTANGRQAREGVRPPDDNDAYPQGTGEEYGGRGGRLKFSQIVHPFSEGTGRRYKDSEYLEDWKTATTGTLTATELELDSATDQQAWWEREKDSQRLNKARNSIPSQLGIGPNVDELGQTAFNPPLSLKCGPLLRYTGMRGDMKADKVHGRMFWRGSVMILTENATSSDEAPPTLRLFKQPMELYHSPLHNGNQSLVNQTDAMKDDPITGQFKCGSGGETLYVKHISQITPEADLSQVENERGLFTTSDDQSTRATRLLEKDGEVLGRYKEVKGHRLHVERGLTFWRFNIEVELVSRESRVAYRINNGPAIGFWVPARGQSMNIMFHSCNGFSLSVDSDKFCGPDPLWRDVLNNHQQRPFHVMIGGGDQIYNDAVQRDTHHFQEWLGIKNPDHKYSAPFSELMQDELEKFYLHRYAMWFSQGLFGMANSQIPMINIWDDHDIIDGYGSYAHHFMSCPVFTGLGAVAFKYYMLFQHQSLPAEDSQTEPSWIRGASRGPYINQYSRSVYLSLGQGMSFVGLDCRTERLHDEVLSDESYKIILDRLDREIQKGEVKHLIVLLGVPIAYPRMTFAENILTSRAMDPVKAIARTGIMGGFMNKFDGSVEVLDDLNDHWTAKHHKVERNWLVEDLQEFAAEKSVRITILGGDVHLAAVGQFYSKKKLAIPKDHDHRYIPNVISSAIANTPPPKNLADFLSKRNKIHHLDDMTDENMIPLFTYDVNGQKRNNHHLLPRRNYCVIRPYKGDETPPASVFEFDDDPPPKRRRSLSFSRRNSSSSVEEERRPSLLRRLSNRVAPPSSFKDPSDAQQMAQSLYSCSASEPHFDVPSAESSRPTSQRGSSTAVASSSGSMPVRRDSFLRRPNIGSDSKSWAKDPTGRQGHIDLSGGLEVIFKCEVNQRDPGGKTMPYRLIVPALTYNNDAEYHRLRPKRPRMTNVLGSFRRNKQQDQTASRMTYGANEHTKSTVEGERQQATAIGSRDKAALIAANALNTDRASTAQSVNNEVLHEPDQDLRERATLDSLPRSIVIETKTPSEVPTQPYQEQRRGELDQNRGTGSVGRARSLTGRNNSTKRAEADHAYESKEDRAYWGAQQVRGEISNSRTAPSERKQEKGLRRYYASPFGSTKRHDYNPERSPPLPTTGLDPPLGRVNNRVNLQTTKAPSRSNAAATDGQYGSSHTRRAVSDPTQDNSQRQVPSGSSAAQQQSSENKRAPRKAGRPQEKDPYAHYLPEAVEAEFESDDEISDLETDMHHGANGHDDVSEISSVATERRQSHASHDQHHRESFVSAQTNTSVAQNRGRVEDSPLYSDEDELDDASQDRLTPEPPPRSPERRRRTTPQPRPLSKIERLTGASSSEQRASYASGGSLDNEGVAIARPVGQGASSKAAKMLGADPDNDLEAFSVGGVGKSQSSATGGKLGGLARRLSERGGKAKRRLSGGV